MLLRLSRTAFWLAAAAAGLSLVGPDTLAGPLTLASVAFGIAAFALWRTAVAQRRRDLVEEAVPAAVPLDEAGLLEIATQVARRIADAPDLDAALRDVAQVLKNELGARAVRLVRVRRRNATHAVIVDLVEGQPGRCTGQREVRLDQMPLGQAIASGRLAGEADGELAVPVEVDAAVVAVMLLDRLAMPVAPAALVSLLELARQQLVPLARADACGAPAAVPAPPAVADELAEARDRFQQLAEAIDDSVFVSNPERTQFDFIAASTYDTWGYSREEFIARPAGFLDRVVEADRGLIAEREAREHRLECVDVVFRIHHPQRGLRWLRTRSRTRRLADGRLRVYGLVTDVTEERQREHQLESARDRAESASVAKSQLMAMMSHEIRTPLNGILGMSELLLGTPLSDPQRRFAQAVHASGEALLEVVNDLLEHARIEAGQVELASTPLSLSELAEDTLAAFAARAHAKGLDLGLREAAGLPGRVLGDPLRLRQVLSHLLANAIRFTEHGEVVVEVRAGDGPGSGADPQHYEIGVRDTGVGVGTEAMARLLEPFAQGSEVLARRHGGTGLGLALARQLAERMGGRLEVRSAPGLGSEFRFTVPLPAAPGPATADEGRSAALSGLRVLVVEPGATQRARLEQLLAGWRMIVTLADDGPAALALFGAGDDAPAFDLALVNLRLPGLDGLALARAVSARQPAVASRFVLLVASATPEEAAQALDAGYLRVVARPVRRADLLDALVGALGPNAEAPMPALQICRSVLVVEDNTVNQEVIGQMLRRLGCRVRVASGAMEGLRALCEERFDLVLMDIQMPEMDGIEALRWFRHDPAGRFSFVTPRDTPVVAVTANALDEDPARYREHGFDDYLPKPFRQNQLLAMLQRRPSLAIPALPDEGSTASGAAAPVVGILDATALSRLRELDPTGANKLLERVFKAFETSVGRLMPQLAEAHGCQDLSGIRHVAHTLKSSSASIGAVGLSQQCGELEAMIRLENVTDLDRRVAALRQEVDNVLQALRLLLDGPSP
mgnify:CR=1 FL=1